MKKEKNHLKDLVDCYKKSPESSFKVTNYLCGENGLGKKPELLELI
jgi:hypothetical protein